VTFRRSHPGHSRLQRVGWWLALLAAGLAGFASAEPVSPNPVEPRWRPVTFADDCREPTALVLSCGEHACSFYRCRDVALGEDAQPREPVMTRGVGGALAPLPAASPVRWWGDPNDRFVQRAEPVFVIPWRQPPEPPLLPSQRAELERRLLRPHVPLFLFPAEAEFQPWFAQRGISPGDFNVLVLIGDQQRLMDGPGGGAWVTAWRQFIHQYPQASKQDVWSYAAELCFSFKLFERPRAAIDPEPRPKAVPVDDTEVRRVKMDPEESARVDKALAECADLARSEVLKRRTQGRDPTPAECMQQVEVDRQGNPVTFAMKLGLEMHAVALKCAQEKLSAFRPGKFSLEPRYRYEPESKRTTWLSPQEVQGLLKQGRGRTLRGTLVPDVVLHTGDPTRIQDVYDFKFPCVSREAAPDWRSYPKEHPYADALQGDIYGKAFNVEPVRVSPGRKIIR